METERDNSAQLSSLSSYFQHSRSSLSISSSGTLDHHELQSDPQTVQHDERPVETEHLHSFQTAGNGEDDKNTKTFDYKTLNGPSNVARGNDCHQQRKGASTISKAVSDGWLLEIVGVTVSIAATVAIVGVLLQYHNHPLQDWPYRITINTLISFLESLAKGAMLLVAASTISQLKWLLFHQSSARSLYDLQIFDDASRGPLGASLLVLRAPRMGLASFSALVVILSFGMDPFTQQILSFPQRIVTGDLAVVGRAQTYAGPVVTYYAADGTLDMNSLGDLPESSMLRAIYAGTFGDPIGLDFQCPSGNCTWPTFSSLAFCTQCSNGTGQRSIDMEANTATYVSQSNISWSFPFPRSPDTSNVGVFVPSNGLNGVAGIQYPLMGLAHFPQVMFSNDPTFKSTTVQGPTTATECALYFCVKSYQFAVNDGVSNLDVLSTFYDKNGLVGFTRNLSDPDKIFSILPQGENTSDPHSYDFKPSSLFNYFQGQLTSSGSSTRADLLSQLSLADNVTDMVKNIGLSMTSALMNEAEFKLAGTVKHEKVFINVHWPWLILPAGLVLSTLVLLVLVIAKSSRNNMMIWKSSALALVFHGPGLSDQDDSPVHKNTEMETRAKKIKVSLLGSGDDWKFIQR